MILLAILCFLLNLSFSIQQIATTEPSQQEKRSFFNFGSPSEQNQGSSPQIIINDENNYFTVQTSATSYQQGSTRGQLRTFQDFQTIYNKRYTSFAERAYREAVFYKSKRQVELHNQNILKSYQKRLNKFSDLPNKEFICIYGGLLPMNQQVIQEIYDKSELNSIQARGCTCDQIDNFRAGQLRNRINQNNAMLKQRQKKQVKKQQVCSSRKNYVQELRNLQFKSNTPRPQNIFQVLDIDYGKQPPFPDRFSARVGGVSDWSSYTGAVIDQGNCGSCYAAAVVQTVEAVYARYVFNNIHFRFSIQQIVDCSNQGFDGCLGGWLHSSFEYVKNFGLTSPSLYPRPCTQGIFKVDNYYKLYSCSSIIDVLDSRPVATGISGQNLKLYYKGIVNDCINYQIDHAVVIVRYSNLNGWRIKNSWGSDWGDKGYAWISNSNNNKNNCGLCQIATAPLLKDENY